MAVLKSELVPRHFAGLNGHGAPYPPKTYHDMYRDPITFAVYYEHHGKADVDRLKLIDKIGELLPTPDFKAVGHSLLIDYALNSNH